MTTTESIMQQPGWHYAPGTGRYRERGAGGRWLSAEAAAAEQLRAWLKSRFNAEFLARHLARAREVQMAAQRQVAKVVRALWHREGSTVDRHPFAVDRNDAAGHLRPGPLKSEQRAFRNAAAFGLTRGE